MAEGEANPRTRRVILTVFGIAFLFGAWHLYREFAAMEAAGIKVSSSPARIGKTLVEVLRG